MKGLTAPPKEANVTKMSGGEKGELLYVNYFYKIQICFDLMNLLTTDFKILIKNIKGQ